MRKDRHLWCEKEWAEQAYDAEGADSLSVVFQTLNFLIDLASVSPCYRHERVSFTSLATRCALTSMPSQVWAPAYSRAFRTCRSSPQSESS